MQIIIYVFSGSFILMAVALMLTFRSTRHRGTLLLSLTYAIAALVAIILTQWWPLLAGFAIAWGLKMMGLDPGMRNAPVDPEK